VTFLSCLGIGIAFLIAVGLLVFAAVMLGWVLPTAIARSRGKMNDFRAPENARPSEPKESDESPSD